MNLIIKSTTYAVLFIFLFFTIKGKAQNSFVKYNYIDTNNIGKGAINESLKYQNDIIVTGNFTERFNVNPCVKRIDTSGNVLWSSIDSDTTVSYNVCEPFIEKIILVDSFIYYMTKYNSLYEYRITKMNANTGVKIWQTNVSSLSIARLYDIENVNSTEVGFYYYTSSPNYRFAICKLNKATGLSANFFIGGAIFSIGVEKYGMCVDSSNNIYVSKKDSIIKLNGSTMNTIWAKSFITTSLPTVKINDVIYTPTDSLMAVSYESSVSSSYTTSTLSINKANGNLNWITANSLPWCNVAKSIINGNYLYNICAATQTPSANPYMLNKINIANGNEVWASSFTINSVYTVPINNIDMDNNYVYGIGYSYCSGVVMKLGINSGSLINSVNIPTTYCSQSLKTRPQIHLLNGSLYAISSYLKDSLGIFEKMNMSKMNPSTLGILSNMQIEGRYHFSSKTIDIKSRSNNRKLVLKKTGKNGELVMYNALKQVSWKRNVGENFYSEFGPISFTYDGRIVVSSFNYGAGCFSPLSVVNSYPNSITMEYFDSAGVFLHKNVQSFSTAYTIAEVLPDTGYHAMIIMHATTSPNRVLEINELGTYNLHILGGTNIGNLPENNVKPFTILRTVDSFTYININESNAIRYYSYNILNAASSQLKTLATNKNGVYYIYIPSQNSFVLGAKTTSSVYTVEKFDNNTNSTAWSVVVAEPIKKIVKDSANQYVYVITNREDYLREIRLYKIDLLTGSIVWMRTNAATANTMPLDFTATDIDIYPNMIAIAARKKFTSPKQIGLFRYDLSGTLIDTFKSVETNIIDQEYSLSHWNNGSGWLYGAVPISTTQLYGFTKGIIYDTDSAFNSQATFSTINQTFCNSYVFNGQTLTNSGVYFDTLINSVGYDSIITLNLTINQATNSTVNQTSCNSFYFNGQTLTNSGVYFDTIINSIGCDSIITLNLTINQATNSTVTQISCNSFYFNGQTLTNSGVYFDTLINSIGCDSIITLNLTINQSTSSTMNQTNCDSVSFNAQILTASGIYYDTLVNVYGCDSIVTLNLTINYSSANVITATSCNIYQLNGQIYAISGTYTQNLTNSLGCDSLIILHLTIHSSSLDTLTQSACNDFTFNGQTYTATGNYIQTFTNTFGCDSIVNFVLNILPVNVIIIPNTNMPGQIVLTNPAGTFQWVSCPSYVPIAGATDSVFTATSNGQYAVIVNNGICQDTSTCFTFANLSVNDIDGPIFTVFPNPTQGFITILSSGILNHSNIKIVDVVGQVVWQKANVTGQQISIDLSHFFKGIYFVEIMNNGRLTLAKVMKE